MALVRMLAEANFEDVVVCHFDHGLRGEASTGDAEFVRELAAELGFPFRGEVGEVIGRMAARGESMEVAARRARHEFFAKCAVATGCDRVLLGHHADDQAETVLWNFLRGSHGMRGMRSCQEIVTENGTRLELQRPLLGVRRADLVGWLEQRGFSWREDATNAEPITLRNRLRNEALPLLAEISDRDANAAFSRAADDAADLAAFETWALEKAQVVDPQGRLHVPVLRTLPVALQRAAFAAFLASAGVADPDRATLARLVALLDPASPHSVNLPGGLRAHRRAGRITVE